MRSDSQGLHKSTVSWLSGATLSRVAIVSVRKRRIADYVKRSLFNKDNATSVLMRNQLIAVKHSLLMLLFTK